MDVSYRTYLDEINEDSLRAELQRREKQRSAGLCDYCGRPAGTPPCRFPERHPKTLPELAGELEKTSCTCSCAPEEHGKNGCKTWFGDKNTGFRCSCDWSVGDPEPSGRPKVRP